MEIKPDKKLITKQLFVLLTITLFVLIVAILLQLLIPLAERVTSNQVAVVLWPITILCILLMWLISVPIVILWIKNLSYIVEDDRVTIFKGILTKQQQNIPYRAITDFVLRRTLYDRFLKIGSIRIQTAGQGHMETGYEGQLSGLIKWEELHQDLRNKLRSVFRSIEPTTVQTELSSADKRDVIIEELRAIRRALEKK